MTDTDTAAGVPEAGYTVEDIKPNIGSVIHVDRATLLTRGFASNCLQLLDDRNVLVFPEIGLSDEEQLAFTDMLGERVNFTSYSPTGDLTTKDVYTVTLDPEIQPEPEYVLGTFFWHMDGMTSDIPPPKASILSARMLAPKGGQTEFANTRAAYEGLPDEEKADIADLRVIHSVTASVREIVPADALDEMRQNMKKEHPLVWTRQNGRKCLLVGSTPDTVVGLSQAEARALLARLLEWTAQPIYTYRHEWQEGNLVIWDNTSTLHRAIPYEEDSGRRMHRTSLAGVEATG